MIAAANGNDCHLRQYYQPPSSLLTAAVNMPLSPLPSTATVDGHSCCGTENSSGV
jgi:hypothetical protein